MTVKDVTHLGRKIDSYLLRYFLAVVEHGSITDAAEILFLAQPSLSQAVRTLERRVGAMLFDRSAQQLRLTPEGERFVPAAHQVLADLESARSAVDAVRDLETGRLDITTHTAFSVDPLAELIRRFRTNYGEILVNIGRSSISSPSPTMAESRVRQVYWVSHKRPSRRPCGRSNGNSAHSSSTGSIAD